MARRWHSASETNERSQWVRGRERKHQYQREVSGSQEGPGGDRLMEVDRRIGLFLRREHYDAVRQS